MKSSAKKFSLLIISIFVLLSIILLLNFSLNKNDVRKSVNSLGLTINPKFKEDIYHYYISNCDKSKYDNLNNKNTDSNTNIDFPYISISNMKNIIQKNTYTITCLPSTIPTYSVTNSKPTSEYYTLTDSLLLDNNLNETYNSNIAIRDSQGTPIWWLSTNSPLLKDNKYLFLEDPKLINKSQILFYASKQPVRGYSDGEYLIYDLQKGEIIKKFYGKYDDNGNGNLDGHDLILKEDGTAVGMRYIVKTEFDLTSIGISKNTQILDGEIVILNSDGSENKVISMMELIDPKEIDKGILKFYGVQAPPYDFVHLNSIDLVKDSVIVSSRNIDAVHKINLETGQIEWRLGGFSNTKYDLKIKNKYGLNKQILGVNKFSSIISSQHDARMTSPNILSIFDNGTYANRNPRVVELKIDESKLQAEVLSIYASTFQDRSNCCGSAREIPNEKWLVNWGGDFRFGLNIPSTISTINHKNLESNILMNPFGVINYRAVPYELDSKNLDLFKQDMKNRKADIR